MNGFYAVLIAVVLFGINAGLYVLNKKTPVPEGCEEMKPECTGCGVVDCELRKRKEG